MLKKLINLQKKYKQDLIDSNKVMNKLNQELDKNNGIYPSVEFATNYEAEIIANMIYKRIANDLNS